MKHYAILNIKTYTDTAAIFKVMNENTRTAIYENINTERTPQNEILTDKYEPLKQYKNALKSSYYTQPDNKGRYHKEPHVKALGIILTYSPEAHIEHDTIKFNEWKAYNMQFIENVFKGAQINAILHMDETTPHIHVMIIPTTRSGKISKSNFIRTKGELIQLQDAYADAMKVFGLQRGEHTPQRENTTTVKIGALQRTIEQQQRHIKQLQEKAINLQDELITLKTEQTQHLQKDVEMIWDTLR